MMVFEIGNVSLVQLSVTCSILVYIAYIIYFKFYARRKIVWEDMMRRIFAASMLPTAMALIIMPIVPNNSNYLQEFDLQIAISGLILLHYLIDSIFKKQKSH